MLILNPPVEVVDRLWMLGTTAYPMYLVQGRQECAIIEGGISAIGPLLFRQLDQRGVSPDSVRQLVITHAHPDHVMAVPLLREKFPKIQVLASHPAAVTLAAEKALALFKQLDESLTTFLSHSGALSDQDRPLPPGTSLIKVDRIVKEGDIIQIEDLAWKVLATPGHSDCSVSLFEPEARALVISDATGFFMPQDRSWWPCYFSDYGAYLASIERLKDLDAEVLCLSHNGALRGRAEVRAYFDDALAATRNYHQQIVVEIGSGKAIRQLAEELGTQIHAQTGFLPVEFFQKNCGLLVKQSLKYAGL